MSSDTLVENSSPVNPTPLGIVGIVGPCGAGKSTLIENLRNHGIVAHHIAQEHSYVPAMWQKVTNPDILIFLDVSFPETIKRKRFNWTIAEYQDQQARLAHARAHAHLTILTDDFSIQEITKICLYFLSTDDSENSIPCS